MSQQIHSLCLSQKQKWNIKDPCKSRRMVSGDKARKVVLQAILTLHFDRTELNAPSPPSAVYALLSSVNGQLSTHKRCTALNFALVSRRKLALALKMRSLSLLNIAPPLRMLLYFITKRQCSGHTPSFTNYRHPIPDIVTLYIFLYSIIVTMELCFTAAHILSQLHHWVYTKCQ